MGADCFLRAADRVWLTNVLLLFAFAAMTLTPDAGEMTLAVVTLTNVSLPLTNAAGFLTTVSPPLTIVLAPLTNVFRHLASAVKSFTLAVSTACIACQYMVVAALYWRENKITNLENQPLMLKQHIAGLLASRGIDNASRYLVEKGMKYHRANRLVMSKTDSLTYAALEELCLLCNCTPNELFVWYPDDGVAVPDDHPLQQLKPKDYEKNPVDRVKGLSLAKLEKLKGLLDELEKEG